jgi:hypothetical protein
MIAEAAGVRRPALRQVTGMQQPLPIPDDPDGWDEEGDEPDPFEPDVAASEPERAGPRRLSAEAEAERAALAVFPGAVLPSSDAWWTPADDDESDFSTVDEDAIAGGPTSIDGDDGVIGAGVARWPVVSDAPVEEDVDDAETEGEGEFEATIGAEVEGASSESPAIRRPAVPPSELYPRSIPRHAPIAFEEAIDGLYDPPPAEPIPLRRVSARDRTDVGASQRAAILAAAGIPLDDGAEAAPARGGAVRPQQAPARAPSKQAKAPSGRRGISRKVLWSFVVIVLGSAALSTGALATGQGGPVERVASSLAPDVIERWIDERVSSFRGASSVAPVGSDVPSAGGSDVPSAGGAGVPSAGGSDVPSAGAPVVAQIASTGGAGVSVRSICISEARSPGTIAEGTRVALIARGVGDCTGWSVVRAGSQVSWVENSYLVAP